MVELSRNYQKFKKINFFTLNYGGKLVRFGSLKLFAHNYRGKGRGSKLGRKFLIFVGSHDFIIAGAMAPPGPGPKTTSGARGRGQENLPGPWPRRGRGQKSMPGPWPRRGRGLKVFPGPWPRRGRGVKKMPGPAPGPGRP